MDGGGYGNKKQLMIDISEIQCSVNRAVSNVFGINGKENELESLKSLCLSLESLNLNKRETSSGKPGLFYNKYDCNGNYYQFLENLRKLLILFTQRFVNIKSIDKELSHLYIKIFLSITEVLENNNIAYQRGPLCVCVLKIWCKILCTSSTNKIDKESYKKNEEIYKTYIQLVVNLYKGNENEGEWSKLLYIILEILKNTDDEKVLERIFEALEKVPASSNVLEVYPGVVSTIINRLKDLNRLGFHRSVNSLVKWFSVYLDRKNESNLGEFNNLKGILGNIAEKDGLFSKTVESIRYIVRRFRNAHLESVKLVCMRCVDYEFLESDLRSLMCRCILESVSREDSFYKTNRELEGLSVSSNLIFRDIVTEAIGGPGNEALETFKAYLKIRESFNWDIDEYMVLKFLINNVKLDYRGTDRKVTINRKYLVDTTSSVSEHIGERYEQVEDDDESICIKYFETISKEQKLYVLSNLLSVFESSTGSITVYVRVLHVLNELVSSDGPKDTFVSEEVIMDLKSALISNDMFHMTRKVEDNSVVNVTKIKLIELLTLVIKKDRGGTLSHRDFEMIMFNVIPEVNSDYRRISQSSAQLMKELSMYHKRFVIKDGTEYVRGCECVRGSGRHQVVGNMAHQEYQDHQHQALKKQLEPQGNHEDDLVLEEYGFTEEGDFRGFLEYYTNSMIKKVIYSMDRPGVPDVVYTLTNFNNRSIDMKALFDLTVHFCKYFDDFTISEDMVSEGKNMDDKVVRVFYSYNYILIYMKRYTDELKGVENGNITGETNTSRSIISNGNDVEYVVGASNGGDSGCSGQDTDNIMDEDGKGDFELSIGTLIITRVRYYVSDKNNNIKYLALLALYRTLIIMSKNEYIFRIRVHEVWDCLEHSLEVNLYQYRIVSILLEIYKLIVTNIYEFVEKRLIRIFDLLEKAVLENTEVVGVADEKNGTIRYKCYTAIAEFSEIVSKRVLNRNIFSKLMLICIKVHSPKTSESIKRKLSETLSNLSKKDPTLVRNVLIEINRGEEMNTALIKYALKRDVKRIFSKAPPQIMLELPVVN